MKYLVDANVLSEATKPTPDPRVLEWLRGHERDIAVDPVILGELRFGILVLPKGRKRTALKNSRSEFFGSSVCALFTAAGRPS